MSAARSLLSVPVLVLSMAGLAGCYDLSAPDGPRREDFMNDPGSSAGSVQTGAEQQTQQAQAERSEQAATAATRAVTTSAPAASQPARVDAIAAPLPGGEMSVAEYVARYIHPAPSGD